MGRVAQGGDIGPGRSAATAGTSRLRAPLPGAEYAAPAHIEGNSPLTLKGKVALVTGSTSGIGLGIARALAAQGADIMLNGFGDAAAIERLRAGFETEHGIRSRYCGADLSIPAEIVRLVGETEKHLGSASISW